MLLGLITSTNKVEFPVCVDPNASINLSKVYTRRTCDEAVIFQSCFLDLLPRHTSIMAGKEFSPFDERAARYVHLSPQEESVPRLPEETLRTHLTAQQIYGGC